MEIPRLEIMILVIIQKGIFFGLGFICNDLKSQPHKKKNNNKMILWPSQW
jgi:hypothetical protein